MILKTITRMVSISVLGLIMTCCQSTPIISEQAVIIPIKGNTYVTSGFGDANINKNGIQRWVGTEAILSSWFKVSNLGEFNLFLNAETSDVATELEVIVDDKQNFTIKLDKDTKMPIFIGEVEVEKVGYVRIDMRVKSSQDENPKAIEWLIDGSAATEPLAFVRDFEPYWGLRGPSVHMKYTLPTEKVEYFYNEITVPKGEDKIGSYFMTNGFGEGYCGFQVNSETERRILFSVWSPFSTDDPSAIPPDERIVLLKKGPNVTVGEFGNEGSGGQSYRKYNWKAGETYKVLTRVRPNRDNSTTYTAWFFEPDAQRWDLIASFKRPKTNTWYKGAHSFLENFITSQGYLGRSVSFLNQWAYTASGEWVELIEGVFTYDATAAAGVRMDYAGGVKSGGFYLQNGGFFDTPTLYGTKFTREATNNKPKIDLNKDLK